MCTLKFLKLSESTVNVYIPGVHVFKRDIRRTWVFISPGQEIEFACLAIDYRTTKKKKGWTTPLHKPVTVTEGSFCECYLPNWREHYFFYFIYKPKPGKTSKHLSERNFCRKQLSCNAGKGGALISDLSYNTLWTSWKLIFTFDTVNYSTVNCHGNCLGFQIGHFCTLHEPLTMKKHPGGH